MIQMTTPRPNFTPRAEEEDSELADTEEAESEEDEEEDSELDEVEAFRRYADSALASSARLALLSRPTES